MSKVKTVFTQISQLFSISRSKSEAYDNYRDTCMQFAEYLVEKRNTKKILICKVTTEEVQQYLQEVARNGSPEISNIHWCALKVLERIANKYFGAVDWKLPEEKFQLKCPYCGAGSKLIDSELIYGKSYGMAYVCENYPRCDAYVGTHKGTTWPRGTLANKELRDYRKKAHLLFDSIWRIKDVNRTQAYRWLAEKLDMQFTNTHIGYFDLETCLKVISICSESELDIETHSTHEA